MTFRELQDDILTLSDLPDVDFFTVGYSMMGKPIYGAHIGSYEGNQVLIEGGIHAREYPTALLLVQQVKHLKNASFRGGMYFIPLTNPDGAQIVLEGINWLDCEKQRGYLSSVNNGSVDYSQWKANANAVDLNVNFDADWGGGAQNVFCPAPGNFVGYYPNSEREVRNLIDFTEKISPALTLSYHSKGEVIYYGFTGLTPEQIERDLKIANAISEETGYQVIRTSQSTGGYSDWVSRHLEVPAFTIEIGAYSLPTPLPIEAMPEIYEKNKDVPLVALRAYENILTTSRVFKLFNNPFLKR